METAMVSDIMLQIGLFLLGVSVFLLMHDVPRKALAKLRRPSKAKVQAKRHFVRGAQLLSEARSTRSSSSSSSSLASSAVDEAEKALALDPRDAAAHILKALALDFQGFKTSALESIDAALAPLAAKSLSEDERSDALLKRAELKVAGDRRRGRVDSAVEDLKEATRMNPKNARAYCVLGECYETKEMKEEAIAVYEAALGLEPDFTLAREALDRLGSS